MALMSELVEVGAKEGLDKASTLKVFARRLREAGRLSQAGRGRGAAHMTYLDASRFLIACAATDQPEQAVDAEALFSNLTDDNRQTLDVVLAEFLENLAGGKVDADADAGPHPEVVKLPPVCHLIVNRGYLGAQLRVNDNRRVFRHPALHELVASTVGETDHDRQRQMAYEFGEAALPFRSAKNLSAELGLRIFRAFASLIAGGAE